MVAGFGRSAVRTVTGGCFAEDAPVLATIGSSSRIEGRLSSVGAASSSATSDLEDLARVALGLGASGLSSRHSRQ